MIIVMGLPGAGKSTVLAAAEGSGYEMLNYGTEMFEIAKRKFKITDRDQLRKLTPEQQKAVQAEVGKFLAQKHGKVLLDTHCSINTPIGYLPGLPYELLKMWKVERLVLVSAPLEDIMRRRNADATRVRDPQSSESLAEHDVMNRAYLAAYSVLSGAPATIIINRDGGLEEAQKKMRELLQ
jgi:adenylate kinase